VYRSLALFGLSDTIVLVDLDLGLGSLWVGGLYIFKSNIRSIILQHIVMVAGYSRWLYASLHHADFGETTFCAYRTGNTSPC
jgi:hypothetical protein